MAFPAATNARFFFLLALLAAGCSSAPASNSVQGTVNGTGFNVADALSGEYVEELFSGTNSVIGAVVLTEQPGLCATLTADMFPTTTRIVLLELGSPGDSSNPDALQPPVDAGVYAVADHPTGANSVFLSVHEFVNCQDQTDAYTQAATGAATLTRVDAGSYAGSFDVYLDTGEHLTGQFDTGASCAAISAFGNGGIPGCR